MSMKSNRLAVLVSLIAAATTVVFACGNSGDNNGNDDAGTDATVDGAQGADGTTVSDGGNADAGGNLDGSSVDAGDAGTACTGPAGTLDPTFGDGGIVWLYDTYGADSVLYLADGKILVGGRLAAPQIAVVRLLHDGSLDSTFGDAGIVGINLGTGARQLNALAVQADGKILAAGTALFGTPSPYMVVIRLTSNGSQDGTFGDAGVVVTPFAGLAWGVAALPDGHIVVSGQTADYELLRFNANGVPDGTFANVGRATADIRGTSDSPGWLTVAPGPQYVVSGGSDTTPASGVSDFSIARFNADGGLDTGFADAGKFVMPVGSGSQISSVAVEPGGRLVAGGVTLSGAGGGDFALARLTSSGTTDLTFGDAGLTTTDFSGQTDGIVAVTIMPDGKIVAVGNSSTSDTRMALARYQANGALDPSFGTGGRVLSPSFGAGTSTQAYGAAFAGCEAVLVGAWETPLRVHAVMGIARYSLGR